MNRTRIGSRGLVAAVGVVIALGAVAYLRNHNKSVAAADKGGVGAVGQGLMPAGAIPAPTKPADTAPPVSRNGQIALSGSTKVLLTQTPGPAGTNSTAHTVPPSVTPAPVAPASPVAAKPRAVPDAKVAVSAKFPTDDGPVANLSATPIADGKAQIDSGNLVAGRRILNDALISGRLSEADAQKAKELIATANEALVFSPRRATDDTFSESYTVKAGDRPGKIAVASAVTWDFLGRINGISDPRRLRVGQTIKTVRGPFHAVVSKSKFVMDLYLGSPGERGSMYVRSFPVGLGKAGSTPTGTWMVQPQGKLKHPKWWGTPEEPAREAGDPKNPLGLFWLGLHGTDGDAVGKEGFGIHGTIDPDSIGKEMSHGCIRLVNENVERVYEMLVDGKSTIIVRD
jgi:lipoprotein-anchoring transpeptidase ErfK/SrfK